MLEQLNEILVATRTNAVVDSIQLSETDYIDPESCQRGLYPHWGRLRRPGTGETFLLTERTFRRINESFRYLPSKLIEFYLGQAQGEKVTILDVGGGRDATSAREIASRYPNAQVVSIDIVAVDECSGNFTSQQGDICYLGLPDTSVTLIYSHQVLPYMSQKNGCARQIRTVEQIMRLLKAGGTSIIDYANAPPVPEGVLTSIK